MLRKIVKYLILSFLLLFSCTSISPEDHFSNERHKITHEVLKAFVKAMEAKGLHAAGIGEGLDHSNGKQNYLQVTFDIEKLPDVDFARPIIVEVIQKFLKDINSKEGIEKYLAEYPFPLRFVHIAFVNHDNENGLFSVSNFDEELRYTIDDPKNPMGPPLEIHRESFSDAVRILAQQETKNIRTYFTKNP